MSKLPTTISEHKVLAVIAVLISIVIVAVIVLNLRTIKTEITTKPSTGAVLKKMEKLREELIHRIESKNHLITSNKPKQRNASKNY